MTLFGSLELCWGLCPLQMPTTQPMNSLPKAQKWLLDSQECPPKKVIFIEYLLCAGHCATITLFNVPSRPGMVGPVTPATRDSKAGRVSIWGHLGLHNKILERKASKLGQIDAKEVEYGGTRLHLQHFLGGGDRMMRSSRSAWSLYYIGGLAWAT